MIPCDDVRNLVFFLYDQLEGCQEKFKALHVRQQHTNGRSVLNTAKLTNASYTVRVGPKCVMNALGYSICSEVTTTLTAIATRRRQNTNTEQAFRAVPI